MCPVNTDQLHSLHIKHPLVLDNLKRCGINTEGPSNEQAILFIGIALFVTVIDIYFPSIPIPNRGKEVILTLEYICTHEVAVNGLD